ncbi:MAG: PorP/SprF family type IX secretion system membrane protein, partial [Bacteroidota bacterium]
SFEGSPSTQVFNIHSPLKNERIGLGLSVYHDEIGVSNQTSVFASYAYRIPLKVGDLAFGLQGGMLNWRSDLSQLTQRDGNDPVFSGADNPNLWLPNFGAGVYYQADLFYIGFSVPNILTPDLRKDGLDPTTQDMIASQYRHMYLAAGLALKLNRNLVFKPALLIKNTDLLNGSRISAPTQYDIDVAFLFRETLWLGASYRSAFQGSEDPTSFDSVDFLLGVQLKNGLRIGTAYDMTLSDIKQVSDGSYEIMVGYEFNYKKDKIVTPRYF